MEENKILSQYVAWRESLSKGRVKIVDFRFLLPATKEIEITDPKKALNLLNQGYLPPTSPYDFTYAEIAYQNKDFDKNLDQRFERGK